MGAMLLQWQQTVHLGRSLQSIIELFYDSEKKITLIMIKE